MPVFLCPTCKPHPFQDRAYGPQKRMMTTKAEGKGYCCTVCGNVRHAGGDIAPKKK